MLPFAAAITVSKLNRFFLSYTDKQRPGVWTSGCTDSDFGTNYRKEKSICIQQSTVSIRIWTRYLGCSRALQLISVPVCLLCLWKSLAKLLSAQKLYISFLSALSVLLAFFNLSSCEVICHQDDKDVLIHWPVSGLHGGGTQKCQLAFLPPSFYRCFFFPCSCWHSSCTIFV